VRKLHTVFTVILYMCIIGAYSIVLNALMLGSIFGLKYHILEFILFWVLISTIIAVVSLIITYYLNDAEGMISDLTADRTRLLIITAFAVSLTSVIGWLYQLVVNWHTPFM